MNNINQFLAEFKEEFQRNAYFVCRIFLSPNLRHNILEDAAHSERHTGGASEHHLQRAIDLMAAGWLVSDARLPDRGMGLTPLSMYGITEQFPFHAEFSPLECRFISPLMTVEVNRTTGADNPVPRLLSYWQNQIQKMTRGPLDGLDFAFPADYYSTVELTALDTQLRGTTTWRFEKVYPSSVGTVEMSWGQSDAFVSHPVTFVYSYWTMETPQFGNMPQDNSALQEASLFHTHPQFRLAVNIGRPIF